MITLASGLTNPAAIAVNSASVYWVDNTSFAGSGIVNKVPINGGAVTFLISGVNAPAIVAVDATSVYWTEVVQ